MLFNKSGRKFEHKVSIQRDPNVEPTFSYTFPVKRGTKVDMLWARKVRPIKSLTRQLQGLNLKRNVDYMIEYNALTETYDYYFHDAKHQTIFALVNLGTSQPLKNNPHIMVECPVCLTKMEKHDLRYV